MKKVEMNKKAKKLSVNIQEPKTWEEIRKTKKEDLEKEVERMEEIQSIIMEGLKEEEADLEKLYYTLEYDPYMYEGDRDLSYQDIYHAPVYLVEEELKYYAKRRGEIYGFNIY